MKNLRKISAIIILGALALPASARMINLRGTVLQANTKEPLVNVSITNADTEKLIGSTNDEGKFTLMVDDQARLIFSHLACEDTDVPVNGQMILDVTMMPSARQLDEILVTAKRKARLFVGDAELIMKGNYVYLHKPVEIDHRIFSSSKRITFQPAIYNVTRRELTYLKPVVFDGFRYDITQRRMLDWDASKDPLTPYKEIKETGRRTNDTILLVDSLYVENPKDEFVTIVTAAMENYNRVISTETFQIAHGTINPMRMLDYRLNAPSMTDKRYLPEPEVALRSTQGDVNLVFNVGKSNLDLSLGDNAREIEGMVSEFRVIESDPNMALKSFVISGTASPEGNYKRNEQLANQRMRSALEIIRQAVPQSLMNYATVSSEASVAPWADVVALMRADSLESEADQVQAILDATGDINTQGARIRRLPFYNSVIAETYLPRLRRVHYQIETQRYRALTDEEIAELYAKNYRDMSRYEYWRLYQQTSDPKKKEEIMRRALEVHPKFLAAATDLSALLINENRPDDSILAPFFTDPATVTQLPQETRYAMGVSALEAGRYSYADSLLYELPDTPEFHKGKVYSSALVGDFNSVIQEISEDSPTNEVVILLALRNNAAAWKKAEKLGDTPRELYLKAVAANRNNEYLKAMTYLREAIAGDPELRNTAATDGDLIEIYEEILNEDAQNSETNE